MSRVSAVTLRSIIASMSSTSDCSSGSSAPTPALLTSIVMPGSVASMVSIRFRSALSLRSAATVLTCDPSRRRCAWPRRRAGLVARDENEVVAAAGQPVGIDRANSRRGSGHDCDTFGGSGHGIDPFCVALLAFGSSAFVLLNTYVRKAGNTRYAV